MLHQPNDPVDIETSAEVFNDWFRSETQSMHAKAWSLATELTNGASLASQGFTLSPSEVLRDHPQFVSVYRQMACPALARERLAGLARVRKTSIERMEEGKNVSPKVKVAVAAEIEKWLPQSPVAREMCANDRLVVCRIADAVYGSVYRNSQEERQLNVIVPSLHKQAYTFVGNVVDPLKMKPGTYGIHVNLYVGSADKSKIPMDLVVMPHLPVNGLPILIELKSAGDTTNVNKRVKEEVRRMDQLQYTYPAVRFVLFLGGFFNGTFLKHLQPNGIEWLWEHRVSDLAAFGL